MYIVTKESHFCYGHRLIHHEGKCRHIHGHSVKVAISIKATELDAQGMVCDFSDIKSVVNDYVDNVLDHNFLLFKEDPLIDVLIQNNERSLAVDSHPTAEFLCKMLFDYVKSQGFNVHQVTLWETSSASATYQEF